MSWYEYNEELHLKNERQIAYEEGIEFGVKQGLEQGLERGLEQGDIKYIIRMHKNGYPLNRIAEIAAKILEEVQIEKEEPCLKFNETRHGNFKRSCEFFSLPSWKH